MNVLTQPPLFWEAFFLIFCRVGTILTIAPIFGNRSAPVQLRIAFSLIVSLVLLPLATAGLTGLQESVPGFLALAAQQILIGGIVGFGVLVLFVALQSAGHIVGLQMGFSLANVINPLTADHASLIDQFYALMAALIFLTINGHHALLIGVQRTFEIMPLDHTVAGLPPAKEMLTWGRDIFAIASRISLPTMAALLLTDVSLAIVARSVPQLNVFVVGMPVKIMAGYALLIVTVPVVAVIMSRVFADMAGQMASLLQGM